MPDAHSSCKLFDNAPHDLFCDAITPHCTRFVNASEYPSGADLRDRRPNIDRRFDPIWNWNGSNMTTLSNQVNNCPVIFSLLKMIHVEVDEFGSTLKSNSRRSERAC